MTFKNKIILLLAVLLALLVVILVITKYSENKNTNPGEQTVCTLEAKLCPDGSYVGRTGPMCEFSPCPTDTLQDWASSTNSVQHVSFSYPKGIGTTYIGLVDWPPKVNVTNDVFSCTEAGTAAARAGITEKSLINGREYCVTTESEGAAGSIYNQYAYAMARGSQTAIFTFSLRYPQCLNYDDPQQSACQAEEQSFSVDSLVDRIAQTLK